MDANYILAINPGATSTKIAVYHSNKFVFLKTIRHDCDELLTFQKTVDQLDFRMGLVLTEVKENHIPDKSDFDVRHRGEYHVVFLIR